MKVSKQAHLAAFIFVSFIFSSFSYAQDNTCTVKLEINGGIGPATLDLIGRSVAKAEAEACSSILFLINTPGGSLQTTRLITEKIVNSKIPFLCLVYPSGGHAGSAGAIILQACHVSGAMKTTNIGAATPISGGGQEIPKDLRNKLLNDTRSWVEGMARLRGRNEKFAQDIILEAKAVTAEDAKKINGIDFVAGSIEEFLNFANGREVTLDESKKGKVIVGEIKTFEHDMRFRILSWFTDPEVAYLILMGSLALLYFEITNPGTIVPGVLGGIGLVFAMVSMHKLDVSWAGVVLIILGLGFMVAEIYVASFGILGIAGALAFVGGSFLLYDPEVTGFRLGWGMILPTVVLFSAFSFGAGYMALQTFRVKKRGEFSDIERSVVEVTAVDRDKKTGMIFVEGENWKFESEDELSVGDKAKVVSHSGLTIKIKKLT